MFSWRRTSPRRWWWGVVVIFLVACSQVEPRIPVVLTTFPVEIGAPEDIVVNSRTGYVYIMNRGNRVGVLKDLEQVALLETSTDLFVEPNDLAVDEERNWVYVVNKDGDSIAVIKDTEVVAIVEAAGRQPEAVAVEPISGWAYVVGRYRQEPPRGEEPVVGGHVTILNGPERVGTISLGAISAHDVVVDPVHGYVYVAGWQETDASPIGHPTKGVIVVFEGLEEIARLETLLPVNTLDVNPETGEVYASGADQRLYRFKKGKLLDTIDLIEGNGSIRNLRVHPETGDVYLVAWREEAEVIVVRGRRVIARIPSEGSILKMTVDPVSGNVYVADFWYNTVTVIHGTEVIATIETGLYPYGIGVNAANGQVYIANTNEGTVTVLGLPEATTSEP